MHIKLDLNYLIIKLVLIVYICACYILSLEFIKLDLLIDRKICLLAKFIKLGLFVD